MPESRLDVSFEQCSHTTDIGLHMLLDMRRQFSVDMGEMQLQGCYYLQQNR